MAALVTVAAARAGHEGARAIAFLLVATPLLITLLTDLLARLVYPPVLGLRVAAALVLAAPEPGGLAGALISGGIATVVAALLVLVAHWLWPDQEEPPLGTGDILIAATAGAMLGPERTAAALFAGMALAAGAAVVLLLTQRAQRADAMPYGVYLCATTLVALAL